jgi:hypothetical protein
MKEKGEKKLAKLDGWQHPESNGGSRVISTVRRNAHTKVRMFEVLFLQC